MCLRMMLHFATATKIKARRINLRLRPATKFGGWLSSSRSILPLSNLHSHNDLNAGDRTVVFQICLELR